MTTADGTQLILCFAQDITEDHTQTDELITSNQQLTRVIEHAPVALFSLDLECRVLSWNVAAEQIFGWPADEILGRPLPANETSGPDHELLRSAVTAGDVWRMEDTHGKGHRTQVISSEAFEAVMVQFD